MRATTVEFRLRMAIMVAVIAVGFWAPWVERLGLGRRMPLLEWLALELSRTGAASFSVAAPLAIVLAALVAAVAAALRIWGTAYLGAGTVNHWEMKAGAVMADGPYRYVRNPLYLGSWTMIATLSFLMPPTGALLVMVLLTVFLLRLILAEEAFLAARLGEPYRAYRNRVPRLLPHLRAPLAPSGYRPHWPLALLAETNPIGIFFIMAVLSWSYDYRLMVRAILVCFGLSLVVRAMLPSVRQEASLQER